MVCVQDSFCLYDSQHLPNLQFPGADVVGCVGVESWQLSFTNVSCCSSWTGYRYNSNSLSLSSTLSPSPQVMSVNLTGISFDASSLNLSLPTISDLDLDGHPDIITPVFSHSTSTSTSSSFESEGSVEPKPQLRPLVLLGSAGGRLRPQWDLFSEAAAANVTQAAFFDLWEDVSR